MKLLDLGPIDALQRGSPYPIGRDEDGALALPSVRVDHAPYGLEGFGGVPDWRGEEERHDAANEGELSIGVSIAGEREDRLPGTTLRGEAGGLAGRRDGDDDVAVQPSAELTGGL